MYAVQAMLCALVLAITSSFYSCGVSQGGSSGRVSHSAPTVKLSVTPASGVAPLVVKASTAGSSDPNSGGTITKTSIDFGDGTVVNAGSAEHTYNTPGNYTVTATGTDNFTLSSKRTATVSVTTTASPPPPPTVTVNLNGTNYTLKGHPIIFFDGAGGTLDISNKYNRGLPAKATAGNPAWQGVIARSNFVLANEPYQDADGNPIADNSANYYIGGTAVLNLAMRWYSDNTQTAALNAALYILNNLESYYPLYCDDQGGTDCNSNSGYTTSYTGVYYFENWIMAFELVRSQMTSAQQQVFADKILNDISAFGGIGGSPSTSCTNPSVINDGTITSARAGSNKTTIINTSSTLFGSGNPIQIGYWVSMPGAGFSQVQSIQSPTQATISLGSNGTWVGLTGTFGYRRNTWQAGDCGMVWVTKHDQYMPQSIAYVNGSSLYPSGNPPFNPGGLFGATCGSNNIYSVYPGFLSVWFSLVDIDANAAQRSQASITTLYNDWYTGCYTNTFTKSWTGFTQTGGGTYSLERPSLGARMAAILNNSINGPPPAVGGIWDQDLLYHDDMNLMPSLEAFELLWGQNVLYPAYYDAYHLSYIMPTYYIYRNTTLGKWFNWRLHNHFTYTSTFGNAPGTNLSWSTTGFGGSQSDNAFFLYALTDPNFPSLDMTQAGTPTAVALNQVMASSNTAPQSVLMSRTGYSSVADTLINFYAMYEQFIDHNYPCGSGTCLYPLDYRIFKGNYLLAPDGPNISGTFTTYGSYWNNAGSQSSGYIEIGGAYNLINGASGTALYTTMPRADTDGTNNRFAYAMGDASNSYASSVAVTRVQRQLIDFKKSGTQQFVVVYDDVATSVGQQKQTYLHYPNNFGASTDSTKGATNISGSTITSSYPGTGHGDETQLLTEVLAPAGAGSVYVYTDNPNGTYTGGNGSTFRVSICASAAGLSCDSSNLAAEFLVVHEPVVGSSNSLPAISLLSTIDTNHRGAQIDGSSAKVAIFARAGQLFNGASFTTTHSGTGQYLIAGLTPGHYSVSVGGGTVLTNTAVVANDNTLYFESSSGVVSVTWTGP